MLNLYPVNLDIEGRLCVVVGGGGVAGRKVEGLLFCGAKVVIISPRISSLLSVLVEKGEVEWRQRGFRRGDLEGAFLVFAATDQRDVQDCVFAEARAGGILINSADSPKSCSFHVPARVRRGGLLLTVSTAGGSPALASRIRKELEDLYGLEYEQYVKLLAGIRAKIVADGNTSASHRSLFKKLLRLNIPAYIQRNDWPSLQRDLGAILPGTVNVVELVETILGEQGDVQAP